MLVQETVVNLTVLISARFSLGVLHGWHCIAAAPFLSMLCCLAMDMYRYYKDIRRVDLLGDFALWLLGTMPSGSARTEINVFYFVPLSRNENICF